MMVNEKKKLRQEAERNIGNMTAEERIVADAHIATQVTHLSYWDDASIVVGYMAMDDEVDVQAVLRAASRAGKTIALPYIHDGRMVMRRASRYPRALESHPLGFLQPLDDEPVIEDLSGAILIVPGRAFDRAGRRVGRGGAYYDRYLSGNTNALAVVGVCYAVQFHPSVPAGPEDRSVQIVVTDSETCFCSRPQKN